MLKHTPDAQALRELSEALFLLPAPNRLEVLFELIGFSPCMTFELSMAVGPLRALFANYWEFEFQEPVPIRKLREVACSLRRVDIKGRLINLLDDSDLESLCRSTQRLVRFLHRLCAGDNRQGLLFGEKEQSGLLSSSTIRSVGRSTQKLSDLVDPGIKFGTIYADPPWQYDNTASRGAANNHYPTMSVDEICDEPVRKLVADQSHLHLWTTNAFLPAAFKVMDAWGFRYKSCLLWIKDEIGMGNYWRVSHEFLLLGVRGNLRFRERHWPSWIQHPRSAHSRKPPRIRLLIERVIPGPYLEMYGRQELHDPDWTVYGNQVKRTLF